MRKNIYIKFTLVTEWKVLFIQQIHTYSWMTKSIHEYTTNYSWICFMSERKYSLNWKKYSLNWKKYSMNWKKYSLNWKIYSLNWKKYSWIFRFFFTYSMNTKKYSEKTWFFMNETWYSLNEKNTRCPRMIVVSIIHILGKSILS